VEQYLEALRAELIERGADIPKTFETVYIGGGTPTSLPVDELAAFVRDLSPYLSSPGAEVTVEANPGTVDAGALGRLAAVGVTRLSLGVQSFSPALRTALGRRVTQGEIEEALAAVAEMGWREWNIDLIFGIPGQDWSDALTDLEATVAAAPTHISLYDLTYTPAFTAHVAAMCGGSDGGVAAVGAAAVWADRHYAQAVARLQEAGYRRYEVSNFALPGHECRHNQAYWRGEDYVGLGAAAVSTAGGERRTNPRSVKDYLSGAAPSFEVLSPTTRLWEKAMLGLRTINGIDENEVAPVLDTTARDRLLTQGCLERHCGKLRLNPGFLDISSTVISALLVSPEESKLT
jgi:putative oxygen-independent coproporphyrinogen III oxidase